MRRVPSCVGLLLAAGLMLGGCGDDDPKAVSSSATVSTAVTTTADGAKPQITNRQVDFKVTPHCDDKSTALDCEGGYRLLVKYRYRDGKENSLRCEANPTSVGFSKSGDPKVRVTKPVPAGQPTVLCDDSIPGTLSIQSVAPMADLDANEDKPAFQVGMRITATSDGGLRYAWTSRDGAACAGVVPDEKLARTTCRWKPKPPAAS